MLSTVLNIFIGILIWQVVVTFVLVVTEEDTEKTVYIGGGVPFWVLFGICRVFQKTIKKVRYYSVRSVLVDADGNWFHCRVKHTDCLLDDENRTFKFPLWTDELRLKYPKSMWSAYFQRNSCQFRSGNFRYAPKKIWSQFPEIKF